MSSVVRVTNHLPRFGSLTEAAMDRALATASLEILRYSKILAPHLHGQLRSSGMIEREGVMKFKVYYGTPYAAYQEFGSWPDGSHVIKHHTEPSTQTHYLKDAGDKVTSREHFETILKTAARTTRL